MTGFELDFTPRFRNWTDRRRRRRNFEGGGSISQLFSGLQDELGVDVSVICREIDAHELEASGLADEGRGRLERASLRVPIA